jgi:hypothetical protein
MMHFTYMLGNLLSEECDTGVINMQPGESWTGIIYFCLTADDSSQLEQPLHVNPTFLMLVFDT